MIKIIKKSITDISVDAIVNAANEHLAEGGGVCGYIFKAAGSKELTSACDKIGFCPTGSAVITPGFKSKAKYIIHAVGPVYHPDFEKMVGSQLYDAYKNSLELAKENNCHSIAFPLISAGIFGYPVKSAWNKALKACTNWEAKNKNKDYDLTIYFTVLDDKILKVGNEVYQSIVGKKDFVVRDKTLVQIFTDTMNKVNTDPILKEATLKSKNKNRLYLEGFESEIKPIKNKHFNIEVVDDRSFNCASKYSGEKVAVLNFANSKHPGGGVLTGCIAQEEGLCRMSNLFACLNTPYLLKHYYQANQCLNHIGSDSVIYTPNVTVFKTDEKYSKDLDQKDWYRVNVLSCAAPRYYSDTDLPLEEIYNVQSKRIKNILEVAIDNDIDVLILGAFGCGAFHNPNTVVAKVFKELLINKGYSKYFKKVVFAIIKDDKTDGNYQVFKEVLSNYTNYTNDNLL